MQYYFITARSNKIAYNYTEVIFTAGNIGTNLGHVCHPKRAFSLMLTSVSNVCPDRQAT